MELRQAKPEDIKEGQTLYDPMERTRITILNLYHDHHDILDKIWEARIFDGFHIVGDRVISGHEAKYYVIEESE